MVGEPYARELLGAEILVSDDNDSYGVVAAEFWAYRTSSVRRAREEEVRKAPLEVDLGASRSTEWGNRDEEYKKKLEEDLKRLRGELEELTEEGAKRISGGCIGSSTCGRGLPIPERKRARATGCGR